MALKKTIIRNDWLKEFPSFSKEDAVSIAKRVGPVLISIGWEVCYKTEYRVKSSATNLMNVKETLYASLSCRPKSRRRDLSWEQHEKGLYKEAAAELREYSPVPLEGPLTLSQLLDAYKNSLTPNFPVYNNDPRLEDPVLIAAWAGKEKLAREIALFGASFWKSDYKNFDEEKKPAIFLKIDEWHQELLEKISDRHHLNILIEEAIAKYKLAKLTYEDLIIDF